jgi:hypothetical protein
MSGRKKDKRQSRALKLKLRVTQLQTAVAIICNAVITAILCKFENEVTAFSNTNAEQGPPGPELDFFIYFFVSTLT